MKETTKEPEKPVEPKKVQIAKKKVDPHVIKKSLSAKDLFRFAD